LRGVEPWREGGVIGVVVHPRRPIDNALAAARKWTEANGGRFAQVDTPGQGREVAEPVAVEDCALVLAVGGDGTVLAALRAAGPSAAACSGSPAAASVR
jgi:NAD kinase